MTVKEVAEHFLNNLFIIDTLVLDHCQHIALVWKAVENSFFHI